ncbi:MAG: acyltransferase family protein, partial [Leucothrix sp.]
FFVISGYLITSIILKEKAQDQFSLANFYERRARRILPALLAVITVSIVLSYFWMAPGQMKEFGLSAISAVVFVSNVFFWKHSSYFDAASEEMPLLHTWSLAVEEQYYIVFPIFIMLTWRFGFRAMFSMIIGILLVSLALSEWGWRNHNTANFFLIPFRAWEILAGSVCAFILYKKEQVPVNQIVAAIGLVAVVTSVFAFNHQTPFPSLYTLLPVGGAVLLILFCTPATLVGKLLASKALVFFGLISYSLYLWHQPILAFYRIRFMHEYTPVHQTGILLVSIVLGYLSWRFIESPFRQKPQPSSTQNTPTRVFWASGASMACLVLLGAAIHLNNGFENRNSFNNKKMAELEQQVQNNYGLSKDCLSFNLSENCRTTKENPDVLLWGDSFAMHLGHALLSAEKDIKMVQMTQNSCPPLIEFSVLIPNKKEAENCISFNRSVMKFLKENPSIKKVVISSKISYLINQKALGENGKLVSLDQNQLSQHFVQTVKEVNKLGREVLFVSPTPSNGRDLGKCVFKKNMFGGDVTDCSFRRSEYSATTKKALAVSEQIKPHVATLMLTDLICDEKMCHSSVGGVPIYRDSGHLSYAGAAILGSKSAVLKAFVQ